MESFLYIILIALLIILAINIYPLFSPVKDVKEGFADSSMTQSNIPTQIKEVINTLNPPEDFCILFNHIKQAKENELKNNEKTLSPSEVSKKIQAELEVEIPGGPPSCPVFVFPKTNDPIHWLDWLQKVPADIGSKIVFTSFYIRDSLKTQSDSLKDALTMTLTESFAPMCPPDVLESRKKDKLAKECIDPSTLTEKEIEESVKKLLMTLTTTKTKKLKEKNIPINTNVNDLITEARGYYDNIMKNKETMDSKVAEFTN